MRAFDTAAHSVNGALLQPVLGFLDVRQRAGVRLAGIRPGLEAAQAVSDYRQQDFMRQAVDAGLCDWAILEKDGRVRGGLAISVGEWFTRVLLCAESGHRIKVIGTASSWLVLDCDCQGVICWVDLVVVNGSHVYLSFAALKGARLARLALPLFPAATG